ncbi:FtsH protease activity modulator HflK [Wolbachia endosymbiont of Pentidionis agamae]|uniref:FtsH protease activity modulator HflK n=1 Tax=Wolbachia endosymbiont of Pentidionis agamae TaxID=3110435 RepID=UPI002FD19DFC
MSNEHDPWGTEKEKYHRARDTDDAIKKIASELKFFLHRIFPNFGRYKIKKPYFFIPLIILLYLCTGLYIVHPSEEGIELIFGKYSNTEEPGLRYNFPYPIGKVLKVNVKEINREEIGGNVYYGNRVVERSEGGIMLTGDENIVSINFEVQWRVRNAKDYLFKIRDNKVGLSVKNAAESAMREIIGKNTISFALEGEGRSVISRDTKVLLQHILDWYEAGIEVLSVQMKKIDPPEKVISSFRDVQSARADKERTINEAHSYSNDIIPRARGEAIKIKLDAEAYENEVTNKAKGITSRFLSLYEEYKKHPSLVRNRIYLETVENIFGRVNKVVVTDELKGIFPYLPILPDAAK